MAEAPIRGLLLFMTTQPNSAIIYLDESGDLGWTFTAPYRAGGSSRYLTIAAICVPASKKHIPKRLIKHLYEKFGWPTNVERKWSAMTPEERLEFATSARQMCDKHPDIILHAITVKKPNVQAHMRNDENKLYNYMIRLFLIDQMCAFDGVAFVPDPRSIKVKSGNSLHDYLQTELWFTKRVKTILTTSPSDSKNCKGIQCADMLAGVVQSRFEDGHIDIYRPVYPVIRLRRLFFGA